jgi:hypothetical protein
MKNINLPELAIECVNEQQYKAISDKLNALGYYPDPDPSWSVWGYRCREESSHVLAYEDGLYAIHSHSGSMTKQLTFDQFINEYSHQTTQL